MPGQVDVRFCWALWRLAIMAILVVPCLPAGGWAAGKIHLKDVPYVVQKERLD